MLNKIIDKFIDMLLENEVMESLSRNKAFQKPLEILNDRKFMNHILKYLLFGALTVAVNLVSFWALMKIHILNENLCNFISIVIAVLFAYIVNRKFVFESKEKNILKEFSKFVSARIVSTVFELVAFYILVTILSLNEMLIKIILSIIVIILNYIFSKVLVFRDRMEEK